VNAAYAADDDEDIHRDIANQIVMCIVHVALAFFCLLFICGVIIAIFVASRYGVVTFAVLAVLLVIMTFIGYFVYKTLNEDKAMKPLRRKIRQWNVIATEALVNELRNFQLDINEHLLLGNSSSVSHDEGSGGGLADNSVNEIHRAEFMDSQGQGKTKKRSGARNAIFGFVFKSFLKKKDGRKRFKFGVGRSDGKSKKNAT